MLLLEKNMNYNDLLLTIEKYNIENNENIKPIICKINNNKKFIKYIHSKNYYYIYLETKDEEICEKLNNILINSNNEASQRHATNKYLLEELLKNEKYFDKLYVSHFFTK